MGLPAGIAIGHWAGAERGYDLDPRGIRGRGAGCLSTHETTEGEISEQTPGCFHDHGDRAETCARTDAIHRCDLLLSVGLARAGGAGYQGRAPGSGHRR